MEELVKALNRIAWALERQNQILMGSDANYTAENESDMDWVDENFPEEPRT